MESIEESLAELDKTPFQMFLEKRKKDPDFKHEFYCKVEWHKMTNEQRDPYFKTCFEEKIKNARVWKLFHETYIMSQATPEDILLMKERPKIEIDYNPPAPPYFYYQSVLYSPGMAKVEKPKPQVSVPATKTNLQDLASNVSALDIGSEKPQPEVSAVGKETSEHVPFPIPKFKDGRYNYGLLIRERNRRDALARSLEVSAADYPKITRDRSAQTDSCKDPFYSVKTSEDVKNKELKPRVEVLDFQRSNKGGGYNYPPSRRNYSFTDRLLKYKENKDADN